MIVNLYRISSLKFICAKVKKQVPLDANASLGSKDDSNEDINTVVSDGCLIIRDVSKSKSDILRAFLLREDLSQYNKIILSGCYISQDFGLNFFDQKYTQSIVFKFVKCQFYQELENEFKNKDYPAFANIIIEIENFIIFPEKIAIELPNGTGISFAKDIQLFCDNSNFSDINTINGLKKIINSGIKFKSIIINKGTLDSKFEEIINLIEKNRLNIFYIICLNVNKADKNMFKNRSFITRINNELIFKDIIEIPKAWADNLAIKANKQITVEDVLLFSQEDSAQYKTFISKCVSQFNEIRFYDCKINKNFIQYLDFLKFNGSEILYFERCSIIGAQSNLFDEFFDKFKNKNIALCWNSSIYINGKPLDEQSLEIDSKNFHIIGSLLKKNLATSIFKAVKFIQIDFDQQNTEIINQVIQSGNFDYVQLLKFEKCEFSQSFFKTIDLIKEKIKPKEVMLINIDATEEAKLIRNAFRGFCNLTLSNLDIRPIPQKQSRQASGERIYPNFLKKLISDSSDRETRDALMKIAANPGMPGQVLSEMNGKPFSGVNRQVVRKNLRIIMDSWIVGYEREKEEIIDSLTMYMEKRGMEGQQAILLYGPPGTSKSTFTFAVAACIRYADTNDMQSSMYEPKVGISAIMPWLEVIQGAEITSKETITGFEKTYQKSVPGKIIAGLQTSMPEVFTKVIGIDEIDKLGKAGNGSGDLGDVFIQILEQVQRRFFEDKFFRVKFDLNSVFIIITGNNIGAIPSYILSRVKKIKIEPLSFEDFRRVSLVKWSDALRKHDISKNDFDWPKDVFFWFAEVFGPSGIRSLIDGYENIAQKISSSKEKKERLVINKKLLISWFSNLFDNQKYVENQPGYVIGTYLTPAGDYASTWVISSQLGKDSRSEHINFIVDAKQNRDNGVHGIKPSYQILINSILYNLQQNVGQLEGYKLKLNYSFAISSTETFNLDDMNYFAVQGVLSIISSVINKPMDNVLAIGFVDSTGHFACPENNNTILNRLSASLTSKNTQIRKIFLPKNLSTENQNKCKNALNGWCTAHDIKPSSIKIFFIDNMKDIIIDILDEENQTN